MNCVGFQAANPPQRSLVPSIKEPGPACCTFACHAPPLLVAVTVPKSPGDTRAHLWSIDPWLADPRSSGTWPESRFRGTPPGSFCDILLTPDPSPTPSSWEALCSVGPHVELLHPQHKGLHRTSPQHLADPCVTLLRVGRAGTLPQGPGVHRRAGAGSPASWGHLHQVPRALCCCVNLAGVLPTLSHACGHDSFMGCWRCWREITVQTPTRMLQRL